MKSSYLGDSAISWSFGNIIDRDLNRKVLYLYLELKASSLTQELGIFDIVPSFNAIAVYFDALTSDILNIEKRVSAFFKEKVDTYKPLESKNNMVEIPVIYDGEDLNRVGELNNLSIEEVIKLHCEAEYQVAMIGFKPHFPYLIGLDPKLETPRLESPRTVIPAGSVAIGGAQTGIYPIESPGGWNLIGKTDPVLLNNLNPGDIIKFIRSHEL